MRRRDVPPATQGPVRLVWPLVRTQRGRIVAIALLSVLGSLAEATVLVLIAQVAVQLAGGGDTLDVGLGPLGTLHVTIGTSLLVGAALLLFRVVAQVGAAHFSATATSEVRKHLRTDLMSEYLGASWELQSDERAGRLQELGTTFVGSTAQTVFIFTQLLISVCSLAIFVITAFAVNAIAAISVAVAAFGMGMLLRPLRHRVKRLSRLSSLANLRYATDVSEVATTMQEIRVFDVEGPVQRRMREVIDDAALIDRRAGFASQLGPSLYQGVSLLLIVGALAVVWSADLTGLGSFGGILLIVLRSLSYGQAAQGQVQALHGNAAYVEMLEDERLRFRESAEERAGRELTRIGELRFDDVSFEYTAGQPVLTDISFAVPHGEVIGIVGPSGAGKSTLVQLVLRLRRPTVGRILADGVDVAEFARSDWFKRVSFVPQDARLFSGTIAENIAFYRDDVDTEAIERAARSANLHDEIMRMPDGYDQWVGEGGMRLSGGQRQRLCIARALVESPDILVLDEPTSALDVKSEALIRETVAGLTPATTVFVIAHRLSTLDVCDRIMVIHDGRLQGFGTSSYLEANDPFYQEALVISGLR